LATAQGLYEGESRPVERHGDVLKRVVSQGVAVQTKIGLADILLAWNWEWQKRPPGEEDDEDAAQVYKEITAQITILWNVRADDLSKQSDDCIDYLASHIHYEPRTYGARRSSKRTPKRNLSRK
jgi:hypothetical protein